MACFEPFAERGTEPVGRSAICVLQGSESCVARVPQLWRLALEVRQSSREPISSITGPPGTLARLSASANLNLFTTEMMNSKNPHDSRLPENY